jgi:ribonuclease H2 subunit A
VSLPQVTDANGNKVHQPVGSGYPGDATTVSWLKSNKDPVFGWPGSIARFSWGTAKELLENKGAEIKVAWAEEPEDGDQNITAFFGGDSGGAMAQWYGKNASAGIDF